MLRCGTRAFYQSFKTFSIRSLCFSQTRLENIWRCTQRSHVKHLCINATPRCLPFVGPRLRSRPACPSFSERLEACELHFPDSPASRLPLRFCPWDTLVGDCKVGGGRSPFSFHFCGRLGRRQQQQLGKVGLRSGGGISTAGGGGLLQLRIPELWLWRSDRQPWVGVQPPSSFLEDVPARAVEQRVYQQPQQQSSCGFRIRPFSRTQSALGR